MLVCQYMLGCVVVSHIITLYQKKYTCTLEMDHNYYYYYNSNNNDMLTEV